jgi:hypothetical protein
MSFDTRWLGVMPGHLDSWDVTRRDGAGGVVKKKAASGGELPEAALAAVRSRDAGGGGALKPYDTNRLTTD